MLHTYPIVVNVLGGYAQGGDMMVYNADRTCEGFIYNTEIGEI